MISHQLKISIIVSALLPSSFFLLPSPSFAATSPTPSPTVSVPPTGGPSIADSDVTESLQERLRKAADEKGGEANKILGAAERKAVVGTLKDIAQTSLTIQVKDSASQLASIGEQTTFVRNGKSAKESDLAIGDYILAMGYPGNGSVLDARRVVALEKQPVVTQHRILAGTVMTINSSSKTFAIESARQTELGGPETTAISISKSGLDLTTLEKGKKIIIIAVPGKTPDSPLVLKTYKVL